MPDILFLAHRTPFPPDRGDRIRSYHLLRHLAGIAPVHLAAFADDAGELEQAGALADLTASRTLFVRRKPRVVAVAEALATGRPFSLTAFADARMARAVDRLMERERIGTIVAFSGQMAQYVPAVSGRFVMDFCDVDSAKFAAYAADARGPMAWLLAREARLLGAYERATAARASASLFVSGPEAALFRAQGGRGRIVAVENGIDTAAFDPAADFAPVDRGGPLIVFTGQMDYAPNVAAVRWFATRVLPVVRDRHPDACFAIVGRAPGEPVRALARRPGVVVTGAVPDVRGWLAAADVAVAPLRVARGIQNKVLEAMAMARPVVASAAAAEGIEHAGTIRVAEGAGAFAAQVSALLDDPAGGQALGQAARVQVKRRYAWASRLAPLGALVGGPEPVAGIRSAA